MFVEMEILVEDCRPSLICAWVVKHRAENQGGLSEVWSAVDDFTVY